MGNALIATSALAVAGAMSAAPASAADMLSVGVGGYMEQWFGYTNIDDDNNEDRDGGFGQWSDSEIHFKGKLESDSGLTFSVKIELEGNSAGDTIDESQLTMGGEFGQIVLGTEDHPAALMHYGNQDVGVGYCGDSGWTGVTGCSRNTALGLGTNGWIVGGDEQKIAYYTPRISGMQFGAAYIPDHTKEDQNGAPSDNDQSGWSVGANLKHDLGDASVAMSVGHYQASQVGATMDLKSGMNLDKAITVGEYMDNNAAGMRLADAVAGKTITHDSNSDDTVDTLQELQAEAGLANTQNMAAFDATGSKAGDHTFSNAGLQVGFGSFSFNVAYARNEGGGYVVEKMPIMVNANDATDRTKYLTILNRDPRGFQSSDGTAGGTITARGTTALTAEAIENANVHVYRTGGTDAAPIYAVESDENNDPMNDIARTVLVKDKSQSYDLMSVGVRYSDGPMAVSLTHMTGEDDAGMESAATMLSVRYSLAPGVSSKSSLISGEQGDVEGTAFVTGIAVSF